MSAEIALSARKAQVYSPVAHRILDVMSAKKSMLTVGIDVRESRTLLTYAEAIAPYVAVIKTHIDMLDDFTPDVCEAMTAIAKKYDVLLFEDRKFADIGATVKGQYACTHYGISRWAHLVTAHGIAGTGALDAIADVNPDCGVLLLAQMSCDTPFFDDAYAHAVAHIGEHAKNVVGCIAQKRFFDDTLLCFMPGVHMTAKGDAIGQRYKTPEQACKDGADSIIVGRGITHADDPAHAAQTYSKAIWHAYSRYAQCKGM